MENTENMQRTPKGDAQQAAAGGNGAGPAGPSNGAHMFVFSNAKSGMQGVDKDKVNRVIYEMSKNSSYFKQAQLQDKKVDSKVAEMKARLAELSDVRKAHLTRQADRMATEFEAQRDLDSVCLVVDMDMFYAAVEIRDRPELADKPVAVGGESMISTTNYLARLKGVRSAMPGFIGRKLCPELVFVTPDYNKYTLVAEKIRAIFREYDPRMRSYSLDEAVLNVTDFLTKKIGLNQPTAAPAEKDAVAARGAQAEKDDARMPRRSTHAPGLPYSGPGAPESTRRGGGLSADTDTGRRQAPGSDGKGIEEEEGEEEEEEEEGGGMTSGKSPREELRRRLFEAARALAEEIRGRIKEATKLTASVGIGPNFMLAKIASDWNKPDGQMCIGGDRAEVLRFLHDLPVRKIGGVGKVQEKCLREALGVFTAGDLFRERAACLHVMTAHTAQWLIKVSLGIASAEHDAATEQAQAVGAVTRKQISKERTFGELFRPQDLLSKCREICVSLAAEMATKGLEAKTVGLKVKTVSFQVRTLDSTGQTYVSSADELYSTAAALLRREIREAPRGRLRLRLMGVKASGFRGQAGAPTLPGQATLDGFLVTPSKTEQKEAVETEEQEVKEKQAKDGEQERRNRAGTGEKAAAQAVVAAGSETAAKRVKAGTAPPRAAPAQGLELWAVKSTATGSQGTVTLATSATAATKATRSIACPVCGEELGAASNAALNRHGVAAFMKKGAVESPVR
eukprot:g1886.t1